MDRRCLYNTRQNSSSLDEYLLLQKYLPLRAIFINERTDFLQGPQEIVSTWEEKCVKL
jgi:hypothetical protein